MAKTYGLTRNQSLRIGRTCDMVLGSRTTPPKFQPQLLGGAGGVEVVSVYGMRDAGEDVTVKVVGHDWTLSDSTTTRTFHTIDLPDGMLWFSDGVRLLAPVSQVTTGVVTEAIYANSNPLGAGVVEVNECSLGNVKCSLLTGVKKIPVDSIVAMVVAISGVDANWEVISMACSGDEEDEGDESNSSSSSSSSGDGDSYEPGSSGG